MRFNWGDAEDQVDSHQGGQLLPNRKRDNDLRDGELTSGSPETPLLVIWNSHGLCGLTHRNKDTANLFHPRQHHLNQSTVFMALRRAGSPSLPLQAQSQFGGFPKSSCQKRASFHGQRTSRSLEMSPVQRLRTTLIIIIIQLSLASLAVLAQEWVRGKAIMAWGHSHRFAVLRWPVFKQKSQALFTRHDFRRLRRHNPPKSGQVI